MDNQEAIEKIRKICDHDPLQTIFEVVIQLEELEALALGIKAIQEREKRLELIQKHKARLKAEYPMYLYQAEMRIKVLEECDCTK